MRRVRRGAYDVFTFLRLDCGGVPESAPTFHKDNLHVCRAQPKQEALLLSPNKGEDLVGECSAKRRCQDIVKTQKAPRGHCPARHSCACTRAVTAFRLGSESPRPSPCAHQKLVAHLAQDVCSRAMTADVFAKLRDAPPRKARSPCPVQAKSCVLCQLLCTCDTALALPVDKKLYMLGGAVVGWG